MRIPEQWTELAEPRAPCGAGARARADRLLMIAEAVRGLVTDESDFLTATAAKGNEVGS
jgi:hypothetical protein